jgi:hypothetical protein
MNKPAILSKSNKRLIVTIFYIFSTLTFVAIGILMVIKIKAGQLPLNCAVLAILSLFVSGYAIKKLFFLFDPRED